MPIGFKTSIKPVLQHSWFPPTTYGNRFGYCPQHCFIFCVFPCWSVLKNLIGWKSEVEELLEESAKKTASAASCAKLIWLESVSCSDANRRFKVSSNHSLTRQQDQSRSCQIHHFCCSLRWFHFFHFVEFWRQMCIFHRHVLFIKI